MGSKVSSKFITTDRSQLLLFPPSVEEWLPEHHLARFVVDIVEKLDLSGITDQYSESGSKAYHPKILLALLFYGYATGTFSSRKIEKATYDSIAFRYIAINTHPDHDTVANFRKRFLEQLKPLFIQILLVAQQMGLLKIGKVSLDGTKVKANASKHHALSWEHACKLEAQLKEEVEELLKSAEAADSCENSEMDIPAEIKRRTDRLKVIEDALDTIKERSNQRYAKEKAEYDKKMEKRAAKEKETGKKTGRPKPKPPNSKPEKKDQVNLTDDESRIMPKKGKGFEQCYNAQSAVDVDSMLVIAAFVSQAPNDKQELLPTIERLEALPDELNTIDALLADAGYFSETNVDECEMRGIEPFIPPNREKHNKSLEERFKEPLPLPEDADYIEKMRHKLRTLSGQEIYGKRKTTVEPVFGIIKHVMGFRQFLLRGHKAVTGEWDLVSIAWNLKRMFILSAEAILKTKCVITGECWTSTVVCYE